MTPREQINEAGALAAKKVRDALNEFVQTTGMKPEMEVYWMDHQRIDEAQSSAYVNEVAIHVKQKVTP